MKYIKYLLLCLITACNPSDTKPTPEGSIESPVITNDLSNQKVTFAEDAQGHIWIGTSRGVNKYNVHEYHQYYCTDDSLDIPDNQINDLFRDSQGRLWVVTVNGTSLYTDKDNFQNIPLDFPNKNGIQILENKDGKIFLNMMHNLAVYNPQTHKFDVPIKIFDPNYTFNNRCFIDQRQQTVGSDPTVSAPLQLLHTSAGRLHSNARHFSHPLLHAPTESWLAGNRQITCSTHTHKFKDTPSPSAIRCCCMPTSTTSTLTAATACC